MRGMMLFAWGLLALAVAAFVFALYTRHTATKEPPLPIMGTVDMPFEFKNQWGETITRETFNGKVWVAYFFFTTCPSICPTMNRNAIDVQREFAKKPQVLMAGFTVDPENDTVAQLKKWADKHGAQRGKWHFLTGDRETLYKLSREVFKLGVQPGDETHSIVHSDRLVLIDRQGRIRGYYSGMDKNAVQQLLQDIYRVLEE
jgi:protein SCO1/2